MNLTAHNILIIIAFILSILAIIKPSWPFVAIAVLLVCVALLSGSFRT